MTDDLRKQRIALSVFRTAADLVLAVERLQAAGSARADMTVIAAIESARHVASAGLTASLPERLAAFAHALSPHTATALDAALARGDIILVVPVEDMETEQTVSHLLLETPALSVQLHDVGP